MIAFYIVSNMALVNAINTKLSCFKNEEADLYFRYVQGSSMELVEEVRRTDIFSNIFLIPFPDIDVNKIKIFGKTIHFDLLIGRKNNQFVKRYLDGCAKEKCYDKLIVMHMDSHCIYIANYFKHNNSKLRIQFCEEGNADYLCSKKKLTHTIWHGENKKAYFARIFYELPYRTRLKRNITDTLYLLNPEIYDISLGFAPQKIEMSKVAKGVIISLSESIDDAKVIRYNKSQLIYIANAISWAEPTYDFAYQIIDSVLETCDIKKMIIKTHSNASTLNKLNFGKQYEKIAYVDRDVYLFEALLSKIKNLRSKTIITRSSSIAMMNKTWFDKEPFVIITLRLFPFYGRSGDPGGDIYIDMLRQLYSDSTRIFAPATIGELKRNVTECIIRGLMEENPDTYSMTDLRNISFDNQNKIEL